MRRAMIYTRISRDRVGAGLGVERQQADCRDLAERLGWQVIGVLTDNDMSAYSGRRRPGYAQLLDALRTGAADAVIAWHTDRLHRSPVELEEYITICEARGVPTQCVKAGPLDLATPSGRMVARQLAVVARYEVEHNVERITRAKMQAALNGRYRGGRRPYGYEGDGVTVRDAEADEVRRLAAEVLAGASLRRLAAELNTAKRPTSTGRQWTAGALRRMLLRARNAGLIEHDGQILGPAEWPAIIAEDTWRAVVALLTDQGRTTSPGPARRWLLSGLARCGVCGDPLRASQYATGRAKPTPGYVCRDRKCVVRQASAVDKYVAAVVVERMSHPDAVELLRPPGADTAALHREAVAVRERLDGLAAAYADGAIDARQLREGSDRLRNKLAEVEAQIAAAAGRSVLAGLAGAADPKAAWEQLPLDRRRAVIDALMTVTVHPARKGRPKGWSAGQSYFKSGTVGIEWKV